jgi:hypothetical protein
VTPPGFADFQKKPQRSGDVITIHHCPHESHAKKKQQQLFGWFPAEGLPCLGDIQNFPSYIRIHS